MQIFGKAIVGLAGLLATAAQADPLVGTWRTEPDRSALVSLVRVVPCGAALCGSITRAVNAKGQEVRTPNVGKQLFWGLKPMGGGSYGGGTVQVPVLNVTATAKAQLSGNRLRVTGCKGLVCDGQTWVRVN